MRAVVTTIINRRRGTISQINSHDARAEQCAKMMRDKAVATADIQNFRAAWNHARDLLCHVISATDFSPPPFARPAAFDSVDQRLNYFSAPTRRSLHLCSESCG